MQATSNVMVFIAASCLFVTTAAQGQRAASWVSTLGSGQAVVDTDLNHDGMTDGGDLAIVLENWGSCRDASCPADLNGDGIVGAADVGLILDSWGASSATGVGAEGSWHATASAEWCATHEHYVAGLIRRGEGGVAAACAPLGACDDPINRDAAIPTIDTPIKTYRLSIHVFCDNSGGNCTATQADVDASVAVVNAAYAPWRIQFIYDTNFINSSKYRDLAVNEEFGMKNAYADSPATKLNVYVVDTGGNGMWGTFPWDPDALGKQGGIVLSVPWFGDGARSRLFAHEVGHCLGLWHVFNGVDEVLQCSDCYEPAGRPPAQGDVTGDRCSDTNPTPKNGGVCADPPGADPCSGVVWAPTPFQNYMSYAPFQCYSEFTPQQAGRMHCWTTSNLTGWLDLPAPPAVPGTPTLTKIAGNQIKVVWADNSNNENGFRVQREKKSGAAWIETQIIADVAANITTVNDALGVGTFHYRVQSYNANGNSAWSPWQQIKN